MFSRTSTRLVRCSCQAMRVPHPIERRYLVEELVRLRRADEQERTAAAQRQGKIDPNPHQVDAVIFALRRIPEGGCILADEVGLGKTIEAGLVIAQLLAEGARRVLVIVPRPLLGQWQSELRALFSIEAREGRTPEDLEGFGVILMGREFAGGKRGSEFLRATERFDLCVIDEAHEVFAGIHRRFTADGQARDNASEAQTAQRVRDVIGATPVVLLTATPIQNSLAELWGLVQYVEPTGSLLGDLGTFRANFCAGDDRTVVPGQEHELRSRLATVLRRTLRRQAQEFLERPFVDRRGQLFEYEMGPEERSLYEDVTAWLLDPDLVAFAGNQRRLLLIGFHRRMASSVRSLAASLDRVAERLRALLEGREDDLAQALAEDLEEDFEEDEPGGAKPKATPEQIRVELERVQGFVRRARHISGDGKARSLLAALRLLAARGDSGEGSGKAVIFTESIATQDYLCEVLTTDGGLRSDDVTLFRGKNESLRANEALGRWEEEVQARLPAFRRPSKEVATRLALVHEFQTRSKVFISTEAGAKGLNLQFCDAVVNYDLPWNPQRIEQRIGRCHRYGQTRLVTVINFKAQGNETEELTFEILSQKLDLFGKVLDSSDKVLYEPGAHAPGTLASTVAIDMETRLRRIWERARSLDDVVRELRELRESVTREREQFEERLRDTASVIDSRFDRDVRTVFRRLRDALPQALASYDRSLDRIVTGYLLALGVRFTRTEGRDAITFVVEPSSTLLGVLASGGRFGVGSAWALAGFDPVSLAHPLIAAALDDARAATRTPLCVRFHLGAEVPGGLRVRRGRRGRLVLVKATYGGLEPVERLISVAMLEGDSVALPPDQAQALLELDAVDTPPFDPPLALDLEDAVGEALFLDQAEIEGAEQARFERALAQVERYAEDRARILQRQLGTLERKIQAVRARRDGAVGTDAREKAEIELAALELDEARLRPAVTRLEARDDESYLRLREDLHRRRFTPARSESLLDVTFTLA